MKLRILILLVGTLLQGCAQMDDYMLGKDNTPKPKSLKKIREQVHLSKNWSVSVGKKSRSNEYMKLKPVVLEDTVYTADASGLIQAIQQSDGKILWSLQLKHGVVSGPSIAHGYIALGTSASSLLLMSQKEGKLLWEARVSGEILSPPVFSGQHVIAKTIDGKVCAFNLSTGKPVWSADHGSPHLVLKASSSPVILGHLVLVGFSDGQLDAYDVSTGQLVWQRSIAYATGASDVERLIDIDADPIIKNNTAYLASYQGFIGAISLDDGHFIWKKNGSVYKNMVLNNNTLYVTDSHDVIWSLDRRTGQVNWKQTAFKARGLTEPVLLGKDLVVGDKTGYLHVLESQTGEIVARAELPGGVAISPNVSGRSIYVVTENGILNKLSVG